MQVKLAYGRTGLTANVPDNFTTLIEPTYVPGLSDDAGALRNALRHPLNKPPLHELVQPRHKVAISVCDITRPMPSARVLPVLLEELAHVPAEQVTILIATGSHRANSPVELEQMLGSDLVRNYVVINHNAFEKNGLKLLGYSSNIPVWLNRLWMESDVRITTGFVEPHFFAGFSGGPKMVAPGLAGIDTIMQLHSAALIAHPQSTWGVTEGNPIHDAIREIAQQSGVDFSLDVTINRDHAITGVWAGELFCAHRAACEFARRTAMRPVVGPFDIVLTTNSGYPLDLNLYQAVKGMSAASRVVRTGGTIICAAECSDGIPQHGEYGKILSSARDPKELLKMINSPGFSRQDQWQVQIQAQIRLRARVFLKSSYLSPQQIRAAHLEPADDIETVVSQVLREYGNEARLCVLPQGPQTIPYLSDQA